MGLVRYHCEMHDNENIEKFVVLSDKKHHFSYAHCLGCTKRVNEDATITSILRNEFIALGYDIMLFGLENIMLRRKQ